MTLDRAADCHAHVFGKKYSFISTPVYTPLENQQGTAEELRQVLDAHNFTHGLLVGASPYGADNSCILDAIAASSGRFKGIALVEPDISDKELQRLNDTGVVGIRINLLSLGMKELTQPGAQRLFGRLKEMDWIVQIHCGKDNLAEAADLIRKAGVRIMVDHFGRPNIKCGISQPGFQTLLQFGKEGRAIVKLSGPFRSSLEGFPYRDVDPFIAAVIEAFTLDNCVWGSDWPFVLLNQRMDYGPQLVCLRRWLPNAEDRKKVLWDTPSRLFGFA